MNAQVIGWTAVSWLLLVAVARLSIGWRLPRPPSLDAATRRLTVDDIRRRIDREQSASDHGTGRSRPEERVAHERRAAADNPEYRRTIHLVDRHIRHDAAGRSHPGPNPAPALRNTPATGQSEGMRLLTTRLGLVQQRPVAAPSILRSGSTVWPSRLRFRPLG